MSTTVYVVVGTHGSYEDRREWIVDAWPTHKDAVARSAVLASYVGALRDAISRADEKYPRRMDNDDGGQWESWCRATDRAKSKYRRLAEDAQLDQDASYGICRVPLKGAA